MPTASLSAHAFDARFGGRLDPVVLDRLAMLRCVLGRLGVLLGNAMGFAGVMWLILAAPGFLR